MDASSIFYFVFKFSFSFSIFFAFSLTLIFYLVLVSRQYVEMSRIRIEGLLAAFPKLVGMGKQHTYIETENVRYVYQPIESLFLLLVTTKQSNILEDLGTLTMLSKLVCFSILLLFSFATFFGGVYFLESGCVLVLSYFEKLVCLLLLAPYLHRTLAALIFLNFSILVREN